MVAELASLGRRAMAIAAELSDRASVDAMFARVRQEWGGVDLFVANAGHLAGGRRCRRRHG